MTQATLVEALGFVCVLCAAGCGSNESPAAWTYGGSEFVSALDMDEPGPTGDSGEELLESAERIFRDFVIVWHTLPTADAPAGDVFRFEFKAKAVEHRRVPATVVDGTEYEAVDFLQINALATVRNAGGSLRANRLPVALISPDVVGYGAYVLGAGEILVDEPYSSSLLADGQRRAEVRFDAPTVADFLAPEMDIEWRPQAVALAPDADAGRLFSCGGDQAPCAE